MDTQIISGKFNITTHNIDKTIPTKIYQYSILKNNIKFYNDSFIVNVVSADIYPEYKKTNFIISAYYNSNFNIQDLANIFLWSDNTQSKIINTNNNYFNNIAISSKIIDFKNLNIYNTIQISACTNDTNNNKLFLTKYNTFISSYYPNFYYTNKIYYPYRLDKLLLKPYMYFEQSYNFNNYLNNTIISSNIISNNIYDKLYISGAGNNNSNLMFIKKNNIKNNIAITMTGAYNFNKYYDDYNLFQFILYPIDTAFTSSIFLITNNTYNTFISAILSTNMLSTYNCTYNDINIENLSANLFITDTNGNLSAINYNNNIEQALLSANYIQVHFNTTAMSSLFNDTINSQLINSHILNCLYLHNYNIEKNKTFYLPALKDNQITYNISLKDYLIDPGYNNIFQFNIYNMNNKNINIIKPKISQYNISISDTSAITFISSNINDQKFIVSSDIFTYNLSSILWNISDSNKIILYNQLSTIYSFYDLLSAYYCTDILGNQYNINSLQNSKLYLSAAINENSNAKILSSNNIYINDDSLYIHDFNLTSGLTYTPIIQYSYKTISKNIYNTYIPKKPIPLQFSIVGKYINRLYNNPLYIYYDTATSSKYFNKNNTFNVSTNMLSCNYKNIEFQKNNKILTLSDNISLTTAEINRLNKTFLSSYINIQNKTLNIYKYSVLNTILNNSNSINNIYYQLIDNIYLYIPTYFIGSIKSNKFNIKFEQIYLLNKLLLAKINTNTYCLDFNNNLSIPYVLSSNTATLNIKDYHSTTDIIFKPILFKKQQFIEFQDKKIDLNKKQQTEYNITNIDNTISNNYNIYFNKNNLSSIYYNTISGIINNIPQSIQYGGIIYNNPSTEFLYNNLYLDINTNITKLYTSYIPNISTQQLSTKINEDEISTYFIYYYPQISQNYYKTTVTNPSAEFTSGIYTNMFLHKCKNMYISIENIINNISTNKYITDNLSCIFQKQTNKFSFIYKNNYDPEISKNKNYINLYFTTENTNKIGIFTLFIKE